MRLYHPLPQAYKHWSQGVLINLTGPGHMPSRSVPMIQCSCWQSLPPKPPVACLKFLAGLSHSIHTTHPVDGRTVSFYSLTSASVSPVLMFQLSQDIVYKSCLLCSIFFNGH